MPVNEFSPSRNNRRVWSPSGGERRSTYKPKSLIYTVEDVLNFDIARDLTDPDSFIATEVFADRAALARQESLAEVKRVIALLPDVLAAEPEATVYNVSSSEPWGD